MPGSSAGRRAGTEFGLLMLTAHFDATAAVVSSSWSGGWINLSRRKTMSVNIDPPCLIDPPFALPPAPSHHAEPPGASTDAPRPAHVRARPAVRSTVLVPCYPTGSNRPRLSAREPAAAVRPVKAGGCCASWPLRDHISASPDVAPAQLVSFSLGNGSSSARCPLPARKTCCRWRPRGTPLRKAAGPG